jgi:filamentous hemagglutinin
MHARHYSPSIGRFLQPDPAGAEQNLYGYAADNPNSRIDPAGTYQTETADGLRDGSFGLDDTGWKQVRDAAGELVWFFVPLGWIGRPLKVVLGARLGLNAGRTVVYVARIGDKVRYVGITDRFAIRAATHLRERGFRIEKLLEGSSRQDARAVEQALIVMYGLEKHGGQLLNKINSIAQRNPYYEEMLKRGMEPLAQAKPR